MGDPRLNLNLRTEHNLTLSTGHRTRGDSENLYKLMNTACKNTTCQRSLVFSARFKPQLLQNPTH